MEFKECVLILVQGLHCYVCSSDNLEDCSTLHSIEELPLELCPSDVASCFTRIDSKYNQLRYFFISFCFNSKKKKSGLIFLTMKSQFNHSMTT